MREKVRVWLLVTLMVLPLFTFGSLEVRELILEKRVMGYLIEERGYDESDIKELITESRDFAVETIVVFSDEPEIQYQYKSIKGKIHQSGYGLVAGFSKSMEQANLIHLE
ncbi:DUF3139 domain-containing protein [Pontibacillus yanchengensis]|uniref:DUF3139 domain-containing protein n=1 Tax=Pontibacillus yanchengensis Y32 TaxID=1385514 RepID=A0A0A2TD25_9BACI|nr:DUF3139 domain-containing protein [Pontibacillus yanchengensis]KGP73742.1 hypothetical protein N782_02155 [Pontibacillus yanchengensis Y32]